MEPILPKLEQQLREFGALRPSTWEALVQHIRTVSLKPGESFVRREGQIAFVAAGLLKEYDSTGRKRPAIINFLPQERFFLTGIYNVQHYIKACVASEVLYLQANYRWLIDYKELVLIFDTINRQYAEGIFLRPYLLEMKSFSQRIELFKDHFRPALAYLLKKEIANYLSMSYHHFIRLYP